MATINISYTEQELETFVANVIRKRYKLQASTPVNVTFGVKQRFEGQHPAGFDVDAHCTFEEE